MKHDPPLYVNDAVTIVVDGMFFFGRIYSRRSRDLIVKFNKTSTPAPIRHLPIRRVRLIDEGETWALGWDGPGVDALKAAVVLLGRS